MKKIILVVGGAGYIGSHVCKMLLNAGYNPVVYDNMSCGHEYAVKWGDLVVGDILDKKLLESTILKYKPDAVVHLAAYAYVGESVIHPSKYYLNNVSGTLSLLEVMRGCGIYKIVFSSTCAVYGNPQQELLDEKHPKNPINPYGKTKLMVENILRDYAVAYNIQSVSLRYFNAAGADPEAEIGEDHNPETHLIPLVLDVALRKSPNITVFGNDYATADGSCVRDYIHVFDIANAHILALKYLFNGGEVIAFNLGNGHGFSVFEVINMVKKITGKKIPVLVGERRVGDPDKLVGNAIQIRQQLGWEPKYKTLEAIIKSAWKWVTR